MLIPMDEYRLATSRWEQMYRAYAAAAQLSDRAEAYRRREESRRRAHRLLGRMYREEDWWVPQALRDPERTEFVLEAFAGNVPRRFFRAWVRVVVEAPDRAKIPRLLLPCVHSFGARLVTETLLPYLEHGTVTERGGAAAAICAAVVYGMFDWDWYCISGRLNDRTLLRPTPEMQAHYAAWKPVREVRNHLLAREFQANEDAVVRRAIVALLYSDPEVQADLRTALGPAGLALAGRSFQSQARLRAQLIAAMVQIRWYGTIGAPFSTLSASHIVALTLCMLARVSQ